jgi:hypothetical protein
VAGGRGQREPVGREEGYSGGQTAGRIAAGGKAARAQGRLGRDVVVAVAVAVEATFG